MIRANLYVNDTSLPLDLITDCSLEITLTDMENVESVTKLDNLKLSDGRYKIVLDNANFLKRDDRQIRGARCFAKT